MWTRPPTSLNEITLKGNYFDFVKGTLLILLTCILLLNCKKEEPVHSFLSNDLFPLAKGNRWLYVDSFFSQSGNYYGKDTFDLKPVSTINFNDHVFTPITDQYDDSIFVLRMDDTAVHMLRPHGESLFYSRQTDTAQRVKTIIYNGGTSTTIIYTQRIMTTSYPSYKIVFIEDNGVWSNFRQQEYFFTIGLGIIKGKNQRKNSLGNIYTTDAYTLYSFSVK